MIQFKNIDLKSNNKFLLQQYNLLIKEGEKVLFNSASGSGKTSLFRLLLGFQQLDRGEIYIQDQLLSEKNVQSLRLNFAYLSQDVDLPGKDLQSILTEIYSYESNSHLKHDQAQVLELLHKFKLTEEFLDKEISEVSGGERQRLGIIILSLLQRPVWLLDEPTSALDTESKELIVEHILNSERTVLVISHDKAWTAAGKMRIERW
jgi:ABC-type multidrug transport system fused ATPase/permease subunit